MITLHHSPVHSDPELMGGTLVFRGTRVPAQTLLDYFQDGYDLDGFLGEFPSVNRADAEEFLRSMLFTESAVRYVQRKRDRETPLSL